MNVHSIARDKADICLSKATDRMGKAKFEQRVDDVAQLTCRALSLSMAFPIDRPHTTFKAILMS